MDKGRLPVMRPALPPPPVMIPRFERIHQAGIFSNYGPQVIELEERFAHRFKVAPSQVTVLANATLALTGLVALLGSTERWAVPSWTFSATVQAILMGGGRPEFVDVDEETHRVPDELWHRYSSQIVTLPFGTGVPKEWMQSGHFPLVVDAAASMASVDDLSNLKGSVSVVFSLHATKYLGAGEGAVVVSGSQDVIEELKRWSNFGFSANRQSQVLGTNAKMSEYQAAIAHCALDTEEEHRVLWKKLRFASSEIAVSLNLDVPSISSNSISPYWVVRFESQLARAKAERSLASLGIESRRWWSIGCHRMPAFESFSHPPGYPGTDRLAATILGLPYFLGMGPDDFARVYDALKHA